MIVVVDDDSLVCTMSKKGAKQGLASPFCFLISSFCDLHWNYVSNFHRDNYHTSSDRMQDYRVYEFRFIIGFLIHAGLGFLVSCQRVQVKSSHAVKKCRQGPKKGGQNFGQVVKVARDSPPAPTTRPPIPNSRTIWEYGWWELKGWRKSPISTYWTVVLAYCVLHM